MNINYFKSTILLLLLSCGFSAKAQPCTKVDKPDIQFKDENNDGIDGDSSKAIFVSQATGDDNNSGRMGSPVATLPKAMQLASAQGKDIYLAQGTYTLTQALTVANGVSIYGNFSGQPAWSRNATYKATINGPAVVFYLQGNTAPSTIAGLDIKASDGSSTSPGSYGVIADGCTGLVMLIDNTITSGKGFDGQDGSAGTAGGNGGNGGNGGAGVCDGTTPGFQGAAGLSACGKDGGKGGLGGVKALNGGTGQTPSGGGTGGSGGSWGDPGKTGITGGGGSKGTAGIPGTSNPNSIAFDLNGYIPVDGNNGTDGNDGNGGGGGGGGGGQSCSICIGGSGNGGGGGGGGGCKGTAGGGGKGGGASIGVLANNSKMYLEGNTVNTKSGGKGGNGGNGGTGGTGGSPGIGGTTCTSEVGGGGNGGKGGDGGNGGGGAGGNGGPSIGLAIYGTSVVNEVTNTYNNGIGASGGNGGTTPGGSPGASGNSGTSVNISGNTSGVTPSISGEFCIEDLTFERPSSGSANTKTSVYLSSSSPKLVSVDYSFTNGTAVEGTDFTLANGNLQFTPYTSVLDLPFTVLANASATTSKTFTITLSNVSGDATINRATATITITTPPSSSVNMTSANAFGLSEMPNPFSQATEIHYSVPVGSEVQVDLYDANGRLLRSIYNGVQEASNNTASIRAEGLCEGIYFYAFRVNSQTVAYRKLVLTR